MNNIYEKARNNNGHYIFDMSDKEDQKHVLKLLGGKELLESQFPKVYDAYCRTLKESSKKDAAPFEDKIEAGTVDLSYKASDTGVKFTGLISGFLCDAAITQEQLGVVAARPWQSVFVTAVIADGDDPSQPPYASLSLHKKKANDFCSIVTTDSEIDKVTVAKSNLSVYTEITGLDPDGNIGAGVFVNDYDNHAADGGVRVIDRIVLDDPKFKNASNNNPIIMLYGRDAVQNPDFKNADYSGGEYRDNAGGEAGDSSLKTLMPISGQIVFKNGIEFIGLTPPNKKKKKVMYRPTISLNSSQIVKYYQDNWSGDDPDMKMYNAIKDSFEADKDNKNICNFNLKIGESVNWNADIKGASKYIKDNNRVLDYQVKAAFRLSVTDGKVPATVDLVIQYTSDKTANLYVTTDGSGTVYIPPVRVYWGCIGKDSFMITDGGKRKISELTPGDRVMASNGAYVTVAQILKGREDKVYSIRTKRGEIALTGGHPVLLQCGTEKPASCLKVGDQLAVYEGEPGKVIGIDLIDYQDDVYNLLIQESDDGTFLYANGFAVGDAAAQNRPVKQKPVEYTKEQIQLQEEFEGLCSFLKQEH